MRFSPSRLGWYPEHTEYSNLPEDIVTVDNATYQALQGKQIEVGPDGMPREYVAPPIDCRTALKAAVTGKRWEVETGGVTLPNGVRVKTAKDDQDRISNTIAGMEGAGIYSVDFKADSGWTTVTLSDMQGIRAAVALHVQACFSAERAHHETIDSLPDAALDDYDISMGWPA